MLGAGSVAIQVDISNVPQSQLHRGGDGEMSHPALPAGKPGAPSGLFIATALLLACGLGFAASQAAAAGRPLLLERSMMIPGVPVGPYSDHLALDLSAGRLFATPQAAHAVAVLDLKNGRVLKMIRDIGNPHGIFYSATLRRLFVADGESGDLKVFSGASYSLIKTIPLSKGADALIYDPRTRLLYVNNGGDDAGMDHSLVSVVDTARMQKVADIPIAAPGLEGSTIDSARQLLYVNLDTESAVAVVDLRKRRTVVTWKLPRGRHHRNMGSALDTAHARLYVACRDSDLYGSVVVLNTDDGHVITTLPIGGWADGIFIDRRRQRIYVSTGVGHIETYSIGRNDTYSRLPTVDTAILAKTSLYSSELGLMYVDVPHLGDFGSAQVLVFAPAP